MVAYTVHRVADTQAQVSGAKMPDGRTMMALVDALEIELTTADGLNSSVTLRFIGEDDIAIAKSLYFQGASITGTFGPA